MKKIFMIFLFFFSFCTQVFATPFNQLVFFGDSLSDNGNLYRLAFKLLPKSPPYYDGRFSNGPTWAEHVAKFYYDQSFMSAANYAVGGATAVFHLPTGRFAAPTNLELEMDGYLIDTAFTDRSQTLFSIWIGGNDYLYNPDNDIEITTTNVTAKIGQTVEKLISYGGKYFVIFNLPDLSKTPFAKEGLENKLQALTELHNEKLSAVVKNLVDTHPDATIIYINVFDIFNDMMVNTKKYNKKYHINIINTTDACWQGSYWLKNVLAERSLETQLKQTMMTKDKLVKNINYKFLSQFILNSPAIAETYKVGMLYEEGVPPCDDANQYVFWDHIHPTATVHSVLAKIVIKLLSAQIP